MSDVQQRIDDIVKADAVEKPAFGSEELRRRQVATRGKTSARGAGKALALRPGREAMVLRRLLGRHSGPFPRGALVRLWREIMGAAARSAFRTTRWAPSSMICPSSSRPRCGPWTGPW